MRLVAVACREQLIKPFMTISPSDENELTFIGFIGLLDPLKPDATQAIKDLAALNVQVCISSALFFDTVDLAIRNRFESSPVMLLQWLQRWLATSGLYHLASSRRLR